MKQQAWLFSLLWVVNFCYREHHAASHPSFPGENNNILEVLRRYGEISTFDAGNLYKEATVCEYNTGMKWTPLIWCAETLRDNSKKRNVSNANHNWNRPQQPVPIANITSCSYALREFKQIHGELSFTFEIVQSNCTEEWYKGGSSFEIAAAGDVLKSCSVRDNFDNTYLVTCGMRMLSHVLGSGITKVATHTRRLDTRQLSEEQHALMSSQERYQERELALALPRVCTNVTVKLDYEHFDAFNERASYFELQFPPLQILVAKDVLFCLDSTAAPPVVSTRRGLTLLHPGGHLPGSPAHGDGLEAVGLGIWVNSIHLPNDNTNSISNTGSRSGSTTYLWKWQHTYPEIDLVTCLGRQRVIMMGASHCRYNWDAIALTAYPAESKPVFLKTPRHHMAMSFHQLEFQFLFFAREYVPALRKVCDEVLVSKQNMTLLIQPGSWDSTFWPVQQFIYNVESAPALLNELRSMLDRGCGAYINFVWVQQVPYPNCLDQVPDGNIYNATNMCANERRARSNAKIALMNAFLDRELRKLHRAAGGNMRLQIVPAFDIITPRLGYPEYVCNNHFICRGENADNITGQTPAGIAVLETVKRAICRI